MAIQITSTMANAVQQTLNPTVWKWQMEMDPFIKYIGLDSKGVERDPYIGKDWKCISVLRTGMAGGYEWIGVPGLGTPNGTGYTGDFDMAPSSGTDATNIQQYSEQQTFPGFNKTVAPAYTQKVVQLVNAVGNMHIPLDLLRLAQIGAAIGDQMEATIEGTAELVALSRINAFYRQVNEVSTSSNLDSNGTASKIGEFTAPSTVTNGIAIGAYLDVTLNAGSSIRRFRPGLRVDIFPVATATATDTNIFIDIVDEFASNGTATLRLYNFTNATAAGRTITSGNVYSICLPNSGRSLTAASSALRDNMPTALDHIIKNSGSVYGLSVSNYPFLKSLITTANSVLSEDLLLRVLARYVHARGLQYAPDKFVANEGTYAAMFQNMDLLSGSLVSYFERNGKAIDPELGVDGLGGMDDPIRFRAYGKVIELVCSPFIAGTENTTGTAGVCYGLYTRNNNFRMKVPPRLKNAATGAKFDPGVEFVNPILFGGGSIFAGMWSSTGQKTNFLDAPFYNPYEIDVKIIPGIKITGLSEVMGG